MEPWTQPEICLGGKRKIWAERGEEVLNKQAASKRVWVNTVNSPSEVWHLTACYGLHQKTSFVSIRPHSSAHSGDSSTQRLTLPSWPSIRSFTWQGLETSSWPFSRALHWPTPQWHWICFCFMESGHPTGPWWSDVMARAGYAMTTMTARFGGEPRLQMHFGCTKSPENTSSGRKTSFSSRFSLWFGRTPRCHWLNPESWWKNTVIKSNRYQLTITYTYTNTAQQTNFKKD